MKMILAITVVYYPDIQDLIININSYINDVDKLLIWLNSPLTIEQKKQIEAGVNCKDKICFFGEERNQGLSTPYNYALDIAVKESYLYLLTMDQDSLWVNFSEYFNRIRAETSEYTAIWGPKVVNAVSDRIEENSSDISDYVISSGSIYNVEAMKTVGGFKNYFIDAIDEEICFRAKKKGYKVKRVCEGILQQHFGNPNIVRFFGKKTTTPNYSANRYYYIVRNHIWLIKDIKMQFNERYYIIKNYIANPLVKVILFEKNKREKIRRILAGYYDGCFRYNT